MAFIDFFRDNSTVRWNGTFRDVDVAYVVLTSTMALTSMMASLSVPVCLLLYPDVRTVGRRLLGCLASANFVLALGSLQQAATYYLSVWQLSDGGVGCRMAGVLWVYGDVASSLWTDAVAFYLLLALVFRHVLLANRLVPLLHVFAWIMPGVVVGSALFSHVFGYEVESVASGRHATWCWISDRVANRWQWQLLTSEGWALASYGFLFVTYVIITVALRCERMPSTEREGVIEELAALTADKQLRYAPVLYILLRGWSSIFFLTYHGSLMAPRTPSNEGLLVMKGLCGPAQGIGVALVFFLSTPKLRRRFGHKIASFLRCCCKRAPDPSLLKKWTPSRIVRRRPLRKKSGSDLSLHGVSFDLPAPGDARPWEDEVLFEQGHGLQRQASDNSYREVQV